MNQRVLFRRCIYASAFAALLVPVAARASINGFGDFSNFDVNRNDPYASPTVAPGVIHLTTQFGSEYRSVFDTTPQSISSFSASFTYQSQNVGGYGSFWVDGVAFVLQDSPSGASAVGSGSVGSTSIANSAAITLELLSTSSNSSLYTDGANISGSPSTSPLSFTTGDPVNVNLSYSGHLLQESLTDTITNASYSTSYIVNLPSVLGANSAYVGITAANNGDANTSGAAVQTVSNFQFTNSAVPEPASVSLLGFGGAGLLMRRRRKSAAECLRRPGN